MAIFNKIINSLQILLQEKSVSFVRENGRIIAQFVFTLFFIGIGIWFIKQEKAELHQVSFIISNSQWLWLFIGIAVCFIYIVVQALMYVASFKTVRSTISLPDAIMLFLKRNFISVFLPAGGISSLAFFTSDIEKKGCSKSKIHFASTIYGFVGILSVVLVAIPAFFYALGKGSIGNGEFISLFIIILMLTLFWFLYQSIVNKKLFYNILLKISPKLEVFIDELRNNNIDRKHLLITILYSVIIEFIGIAHLYIAMLALGVQPSLFAAIMGYIVSVIFLIVSPFLRGLGAIEISMAFILMHFGYSNSQAISITFLYRFFEFWFPLVAGLLSFVLKVNKLLMRIIPAILIFTLGIINIISVLTPAISDRLIRLQEFIFVDAIRASNYFVLMAGLFMLVTAAFMLKGLKSAWWFALVLAVISFIGHITKAIDYEEAIVALFVIILLLNTKKEYYIKNNPRLRYVGIQTAILSILAVLIYGTVGFYYLNKHHFQINFNLFQSIRYCIQNYFLVGSSDLIAHDKFARNFLISINISGFISMSFLIYTLIRPYVLKNNSSEEEHHKSLDLLSKYGKSSLDYFKVYFDKLTFISNELDSFLSYRVSGNYAVVLENPVAENDETMIKCIKAFNRYCYECGLKSVYYRIPECSLPIYKALGKKSMFLGQEGIVDLTQFSLQGTARKSLRNGINKIVDKGYKAHIHRPPLKDGLLQKLKSVSDEWLDDTGRNEIIFSQGMFIWEDIKQQTVITVENDEEKIVAFVNVIPDYAPNEGTYDLIRKTADAPNGVMDFLMIELFNYFRTENITYVNLGFAPMSGLEAPQKFTEKSMKFAYERIRAFSHYKGLRDFKDKYNPVWENKYLVYENDYDLLQIPSVLSKVIKI